MAVSLRRATRADIEALVALEREFPTDRLSRRQFRYLLTRANADVHVGVSRGQLIANAVVLYRRGSRAARLYSLVVARTERGKGIAGVLLKAAEDTARRRRCERLALEVRPDNRAAIRLYQNAGYVLARRLAQFYEDGADALQFQRPLRAANRRR